MQEALKAGATLAALEHATFCCMGFSFMNRFVDAFGADLPAGSDELLGAHLDAGIKVIAGTKRQKRPWKTYKGAMPKAISDLLQVIRTAEGDCPAALRTSIEARIAKAAGAIRPEEDPIDPLVQRYIDKIGQNARTVEDEDVTDLLEAGWSEEAVFEMTYVASCAAAIGRMEKAWQVLPVD